MTDITPMRAARLAAGLTQADVHDRTGLDMAVISKFERGLVGMTIGSLLKYATAVGLDDLARELAPIVAALPNEGRTNYGSHRRGKPAANARRAA